MTLNLAGKTVVITGAAHGIGAHLAGKFAEQGCHVIVSDVDFDAAQEHARNIGTRATAIHMDVRNRQQIGSALQKILRDRGAVDVLINNAGLMTMGPCLDTTYEEWDDLFAVNCTGIFNCVRAFAPSMIERRHGSIINIASVSAVKGGGAIGNIWYGASKAAVVALTKGLSREFGPSGIRVNAIAPGVVETNMVKKAMTPEISRKVLARFPLGRLATVEDVANTAIYLASDMSTFVTGEMIAVDGGFLKT